MINSDIYIIIGALIPSLIAIAFCYWFDKKEDKKQDDGKPIKNISNMQIHCSVVSKNRDFYWNTGLECIVCAYREECKKYIKRYGKLPNGDKE